MTVKVQRLSQHSIDFDVVGVDTSIANAFRRIMIAEVRLGHCLSAFFSVLIGGMVGAYSVYRAGVCVE